MVGWLGRLRLGLAQTLLRRGGAVAAGLIGGLALGALAASTSSYYGYGYPSYGYGYYPSSSYYAYPPTATAITRAITPTGPLTATTRAPTGVGIGCPPSPSTSV